MPQGKPPRDYGFLESRVRFVRLWPLVAVRNYCTSAVPVLNLSMADTIHKGLCRALLSRPLTKARTASKYARFPNELCRFVFKRRILRNERPSPLLRGILLEVTFVVPDGMMAIKIRVRRSFPSLPFSSQ